MATPFLGQIQYRRIDNFAPQGGRRATANCFQSARIRRSFRFCTTYGGDGRATFGLPNLRDRTPLGAGQGPGLSSLTTSVRQTVPRA